MPYCVLHFFPGGTEGTIRSLNRGRTSSAQCFAEGANKQYVSCSCRNSFIILFAVIQGNACAYPERLQMLFP